MILHLSDSKSKVLRTPTEPVPEVTSITKEFAYNMLDTMKRYDGVGLAANQVGSNLRIAVIENRQLLRRPLVLINPTILVISDKTYDSLEGCLSLPGEPHLVKRPAWVVVKYLDQHGRCRTIKAKRALARVIMHELHHLDGLCIDDKQIPDWKAPDMGGRPHRYISNDYWWHGGQAPRRSQRQRRRDIRRGIR